MKYENALKEFKKAHKGYEAKSGIYEAETARLNDAKALVEELEQKWRSGQASILASSLISGEACPVCGSEHHPTPAHTSSEFFLDEADLKEAKAQAATIEKLKMNAESAFFEAKSASTSAEKEAESKLHEITQLRDGFKEEDLPNAKADILAKREGLSSQQAQLSQTIQLLEQVKVELEKRAVENAKVRDSIQQYSHQVNELTVSHTQQQTNVDRMVVSIPENLRSIETFEREMSEAVKRQDDLKKSLEASQKALVESKERFGAEAARLEEAVKLVKDRQTSLETERETFKSNMAKQGFETYRLYEEAKKTEAELNRMENEIRSYREQLRSVSDQFEQLSLLLKEVKMPDLKQLEEELQVLTNEVNHLEGEQRELFIKKRDNQEILEKIKRLNEQMKAMEERYKTVGHLYDISKGQNRFRISFERFVLASFLDDILQEANLRLQKMTSGRYRMLRKTDKAKGNVQSGLELLVFDQYTGQERHVKTLSGGESFKAALSLALGLADVVQNYAGGVSLETMFIDEGFGTLDPESLDQAIESLIDIQSSGRLVGIISHVPELKERIDARLEVTADQAGSRTEFLFTN
ncbi:SbcC/MukB-like Walker B domain-containing protein [Neobacillus sp. PS3-34]|uniref:SbcC/MukB-like Walker B domain-containing protein n=1 Tax=Neobacillus sp. PS3-34 TaxID=3070678 RepID=UPI0027E07874|nr:SbcC/MukB-like Walker B domain-containing protein [Neobacillus sp. PS3-34]WML48906.1 SbcC/MukB-like Walker B domain-containing protein [Neobacillus sp. PS3-34]